MEATKVLVRMHAEEYGKRFLIVTLTSRLKYATSLVMAFKHQQLQTNAGQVLLGAPLIYHRETTKNLGTLLPGYIFKVKKDNQNYDDVLDDQPGCALKKKASEPYHLTQEAALGHFLLPL